MNAGDWSDLPHWTFPFAPQPPGWIIDWPALESAFDCLSQMAGCPQDPIHHAEGDVLTHTKMVCEELAQLSEWREQAEPVRSALFAAALLHDVGKPACTTIDDNGRVHSKGHARRSMAIARRVLWTGNCPTPFAVRELVVQLIRYHGMPLGIIHRTNPERAIIEASVNVRIDWLGVLATADVLGRCCADRQDCLDRIALVEQIAREESCFDRPRAFASDHTRCRYFHQGGCVPDYPIFDSSRCEVVLMSGLPGSGKDHWIANNCTDWPIVSLDEIRGELDVLPTDNQGEVGNAARELARKHLRESRSFVWNATNVSKMLRESLVELFSAYHARTRIIYLEADYSELLKRNRARTAGVPADVIGRLFDKLDIPDPTEAHRVEWFADGQ